MGHGIAWTLRAFGVVLGWVGKAFFYWPWVGLWRYVLVPVGTAVGVAVAWLAHHLIVVPALWIHRRVLTPVGHAVLWVFRGWARASPGSVFIWSCFPPGGATGAY